MAGKGLDADCAVQRFRSAVAQELAQLQEVLDKHSSALAAAVGEKNVTTGPPGGLSVSFLIPGDRADSSETSGRSSPLKASTPMSQHLNDTTAGSDMLKRITESSTKESGFENESRKFGLQVIPMWQEKVEPKNHDLDLSLTVGTYRDLFSKLAPQPNDLTRRIKRACSLRVEEPEGPPLARGWSSPGSVGVAGRMSPAARQEAADESFLLRAGRILSFGDALLSDKAAQRCMIHPEAGPRLFWVCLGGIFLAYDICIIPLVAFDLPIMIGLEIMSWCTTIFWTLDMMSQFLIGFHQEGAVEMRPGKVARHYMRGWLLPDILVVSADWALICLGLSGQASSKGSGILRIGKAARAARALRILRLFRLLRMLKMTEFTKLVEDSLPSEVFVTVWKILKLTISMLFTNHVIACCWYALAHHNRLTERTWLDQQDCYERSEVNCYVSALHWSLTQFTPSTQNIAPQNPYERVFAIIVVILGLGTFSSYLGSVTSKMTELRSYNSAQHADTVRLREYLSQKQVSMVLGRRIWRFFREGYRRRRRGPQKEDVKFLSEMPISLQMQLDREVYSPALTRHPALSRVSSASSRSCGAICHVAMSDRDVAPRQDVFMEGDKATNVLFVAEGKLEYYSRLRLGLCHVGSGDWISELALWTHWVHCGRLTSLADAKGCTLVALNVDSFQAVAYDRGLHGDAVFPQLQTYAQMAVARALDKANVVSAGTSTESRDRRAWPMTDVEVEPEELENLARMAFREETTSGEPSMASRPGFAQGLQMVARRARRALTLGHGDATRSRSTSSNFIGLPPSSSGSQSSMLEQQSAMQLGSDHRDGLTSSSGRIHL